MQRLEHDLYKLVAVKLRNLMKDAENIKDNTDRIKEAASSILKTTNKIANLMDKYYESSLKRTRADDIDDVDVVDVVDDIDNEIKLTLIKERDNAS